MVAFGTLEIFPVLSIYESNCEVPSSKAGSKIMIISSSDDSSLECSNKQQGSKLKFDK